MQEILGGRFGAYVGGPQKNFNVQPSRSLKGGGVKVGQSGGQEELEGDSFKTLKESHSFKTVSAHMWEACSLLCVTVFCV